MEELEEEIKGRVGDLIEDIRDLSNLEKMGYILDGGNNFVIFEKYIKKTERIIKCALSYNPKEESYIFTTIVTSKRGKIFNIDKGLKKITIKSIEKSLKKLEKIVEKN